MIGCGDGIYLGGINMDYGSPVGIAGYLLVGGAVVVVLLNIYSWIYNLFSHSGAKDYKNLRRDAKIVNVKQYTVGSKNDKKIRTTVVFDDGFEYISHKTDRDDSFFSYRIQVTEATRKKILEDAMQAHQKACNNVRI